MTSEVFRKQRTLKNLYNRMFLWYAHVNNLQGAGCFRLEVGGVGKRLYQKSCGECQISIAL